MEQLILRLEIKASLIIKKAIIVKVLLPLTIINIEGNLLEFNSEVGAPQIVFIWHGNTITADIQSG